MTFCPHIFGGKLIKHALDLYMRQLSVYGRTNVSLIWIGSGHAFNWFFLCSRNQLYRSSSRLLLIVTGVFSCLRLSAIPIETRSYQITNTFPSGVWCFGMTKSDALKDDKSTGKSEEASKNDNGNQNCRVFENALFFSSSKIILQSVTVGFTIMESTETVAPIPKVIQMVFSLEWV